MLVQEEQPDLCDCDVLLPRRRDGILGVQHHLPSRIHLGRQCLGVLEPDVWGTSLQGLTKHEQAQGMDNGVPTHLSSYLPGCLRRGRCRHSVASTPYFFGVKTWSGNTRLTPRTPRLSVM